MSIKCRIIEGECSNCGACVGICPLEAISEAPYYIDPLICDGCLECIDGCGSSAIESYEYSSTPSPPFLIPFSLALKMYEDK
jgi:uncharacterized Fe-S center protein